LRIINHNI